MRDSQIDRLIKKILIHEASEQERLEFDQWLNASEKNLTLFNYLKAEWEDVHQPQKAINEEEIVDKIWDAAVVSPKHNQHPRNTHIWKQFLKVAAGISLLIVIYLLIKTLQPSNTPNTVTYQSVEKNNISGQKSKIHLSDGTVVWLNAESTLSYTRPFRDDLREVELVGEAYFEVAKDPSKPFVVKMNGTDVRVLGTSFNISSYQDDDKKVIALAEGKIEISHGDLRKIMTPGWITEIDANSNQVNSYEGNVMDKIAWTKDILLFQNATFNEIIEKLERWYGVKIQIIGQSDTTEMKFNGVFQDEYLANVLENLMANQKMDYEIESEQVRIYFN